MKVRLKGRLAGPTMNAGAGEVIDVSDEMGYQLISNGGAVLVEVIETAAIDRAVETEAKPVPKKRR